jgi:hypothetical protein
MPLLSAAPNRIRLAFEEMKLSILIGLVVYIIIARQSRELHLAVNLLSLGFRPMGDRTKKGFPRSPTVRATESIFWVSASVGVAS